MVNRMHDLHRRLMVLQLQVGRLEDLLGNGRLALNMAGCCEWGEVTSMGGQDPEFFGKILGFSTRSSHFFRKRRPICGRASVHRARKGRLSSGRASPCRMASPRLPGSTTRSWKFGGTDRTKAQQTRSLESVEQTCPRDRAQHRVAQCCIRGLLYHRPERRGPWTTGVCPSEHLRILPGPTANQWIVRGRGSTGTGLRRQPCRAAERFRQSGPVKGPPHHCRRSERLAGGTHPPAPTAYDRRSMDTATTGGRCRHQ